MSGVGEEDGKLGAGALREGGFGGSKVGADRDGRGGVLRVQHEQQHQSWGKRGVLVRQLRVVSARQSSDGQAVIRSKALQTFKVALQLQQSIP